MHILDGVVEPRRAAVVVLENVAQPDPVAIVLTILTRLGGYKWSFQALSPRVHAGVPCERERGFFLGELI